TQCPDALFHTARLVGSLRAARRRALLKRFRSHPLVRRRFVKKPVEEMCRLLRRHSAEGLPNPVPRKLRDALEGQPALSPAALERPRQTLVRRLLPLRLALLRRLILEDLRGGLPVDPQDADERHALQMLASVTVHRRLLRRLLAIA